MTKLTYGTFGKIDFSGLWEMLKKNGKNKLWLNENGIHNNTIAKLTKNENVTCEVIAKLCYLLDCQPYAIISYKRPEKDPEPTQK